MTRLLALDIATTTGYAVDMPSGGDRPLFGNFKVDSDGGDALGRAFAQFRRDLLGLISLHQPEVIAFEAALTERLHGLDASLLLLGLGAMVELTGFELDLDVYSCDVSTVRRHFVGSAYPKNPKVVVMDRCKLLGWSPKTFDESDAGAVWDYAKAMLRAGEVEALAVHAARLA